MIPQSRRAGAFLRWTARVLLATGLGCLIWSSSVFLHANAYQREQRATLERMRIEAARSPDTKTPRYVRKGELIGSLDIPRVKRSVVVIEGDDPSTLGVGAGHLPDTPLPWQPGNSALAGHRDTVFRVLREVRVGDQLSLTTAHGDFHYRVRELLVVDPGNLSVLARTDRPMLTLITCYPFSYLGQAPKRFVVHADRL